MSSGKWRSFWLGLNVLSLFLWIQITTNIHPVFKLRLGVVLSPRKPESIITPEVYGFNELRTVYELFLPKKQIPTLLHIECWKKWLSFADDILVVFS